MPDFVTSQLLDVLRCHFICLNPLYTFLYSWISSSSTYTSPFIHTTQVIAKKIIATNASSSPYPKPQCFYIEWITKTCKIGPSLDSCTTVLTTNADVFRNRLDCCASLYNATREPQLVPQGCVYACSRTHLIVGSPLMCHLLHSLNGHSQAYDIQS